MISSEAIQQIQKTAVEAGGVKIHSIPGDEHSVLIAQGGKHEIHELPPGRRRHLLTSIDDVLLAVKTWGAASSVWVSLNAVIVCLEDQDRRDIATMPMSPSAQFASLECLPARLQQAGIIRWLKVNMAGAVRDDLVPTFRKIDFKRKNDGTKSIDHGSESLGYQVEASVKGANDIPEFISATIHVHQDKTLSKPRTIRLSLDIDVNHEQFELTPLPDELEIASQDAVLEVWSALRQEIDKLDDGANIPVFMGQPETSNAGLVSGLGCGLSDVEETLIQSA